MLGRRVGGDQRRRSGGKEVGIVDKGGFLGQVGLDKILIF